MSTFREISPSTIHVFEGHCNICWTPYSEMKEKADRVISHSNSSGTNYAHLDCLKNWYLSVAGENNQCVICSGHDLSERDFEVIEISYAQICVTNENLLLIREFLIPSLEFQIGEAVEVRRGLLAELRQRSAQPFLNRLRVAEFHLQNNIKARVRDIDKKIFDLKSEIAYWIKTSERMVKYRAISNESLAKQAKHFQTVAASGGVIFLLAVLYLIVFDFDSILDRHQDSSSFIAGTVGSIGLSLLIYGFYKGQEPAKELESRLVT